MPLTYRTTRIIDGEYSLSEPGSILFLLSNGHEVKVNDSQLHQVLLETNKLPSISKTNTVKDNHIIFNRKVIDSSQDPSNMIIYHYRKLNNSGISNNGGTTVVLLKFDDVYPHSSRVVFGVAHCSNKDNFDKKYGVKLATTRMNKILDKLIDTSSYEYLITNQTNDRILGGSIFLKDPDKGFLSKLTNPRMISHPPIGYKIVTSEFL